MVNDSHTLVSPQPRPSHFASINPFGNAHPSSEAKAVTIQAAGNWVWGFRLDAPNVLPPHHRQAPHRQSPMAWRSGSAGLPGKPTGSAGSRSQLNVWPTSTAHSRLLGGSLALLQVPGNFPHRELPALSCGHRVIGQSRMALVP
jgi:hypothetical protein